MDFSYLLESLDSSVTGMAPAYSWNLNLDMRNFTDYTLLSQGNINEKKLLIWEQKLGLTAYRSPRKRSSR